MNFDELGLSDKVISAVKASGYTSPTPIQAQAIPLLKSSQESPHSTKKKQTIQKKK